MRSAAGSFTSLGLELGGKDPAYVREDANIDHAIENLVDGAFFNSGQCCCGIERIYVHEKHYDRFVEGAVDLVNQYVLGNPLEAKFALADAVVAGFHGKDAAKAARAEYDRVHQQGGVPDHLPEWTPAPDVRRLPDGRIALPTAIAASGLASSSSDARRLIVGKGVRVDGKVVTLPMTDGTGEVPAEEHAGVTIDPWSKILMQSDAIDKFQRWQAANPGGQRQ